MNDLASSIDAPTGASAQAALSDWWQGTRNFELWATLAWYDVVLRYRRSILGPLWITLSMGVLLLGMGPVYSGLFGVPMVTFFPHLALGIIFWNFFSATISEGCNVFIVSAPYLKQGEFPRSAFVWRHIAKQVIQLAHHAALYVPIVVWAGIPLSPKILLFPVGFAVVLVNLHALSITLGIAAARFRDIGQIVTSILQLLMFLTPVFWFPDKLPQRAKFVLANPLAQMLDLLRLPLLGSAPASGTWWFMLFFTCLNVGIAAIVYERKQRQLPYWI